MRISDWSSDVCSSDLDSSVTAHLLKEQGYRVSGLFMVNWTEDEQGYCTSADDFQDARAVCDELDIPLHRVDFSREYRERVFARFLADYAAGRTRPTLSTASTLAGRAAMYPDRKSKRLNSSP